MIHINWKPDRTIKVPIYKQIIIFIKEKIESGEWPIGMTIPSQRSLAQTFEVNRSTVTYAIEELIALGILEGNSRIGTKVVNNTWNLLSSSVQPDWDSYIQSGVHLPNQRLIQKINNSEYIANIIKLGTGELAPELFPQEKINHIMATLPGKMKSFSSEEPRGLYYLREMIGHHVKDFGIDVSPSSILIVSGSLQALHLISVGLMKKNSDVFVEKPSYLYSLNVFQSLGMKLQGLSMDHQGVLTDKLLNYPNKNGSLLYTVPTYHNPTGTLMTRERRKELIDICQKNQIPIIEDDAYRELWLESPPPLSLKSMDKSGLVLYVGSTSRILGSGFRVGWVIGPEPVIERLADIKMQTDYGTNTLAQWIIAESLSTGLYGKHLDELRNKLKERRDRTLEILRRYFSDLATWQTPAGGYYIWLRLKTPIQMKNLFDRALKENVLINPGNIYYPGLNDYIRISYSYANAEGIEKGLYRLSIIIKEISQ